MTIYPLSVLEEDAIPYEAKYEHWLCSFPTQKEFTATVKETTYFKEGEKIKFYRVDD